MKGQVDRIKNDFKQCVSSGQDLNGCLRSLADAIKPYMTTGIPELGIPRADPLFIDEIAFDLKNPIIDVHVEFTDNQITGILSMATNRFFRNVSEQVQVDWKLL